MVPDENKEVLKRRRPNTRHYRGRFRFNFNLKNKQCRLVGKFLLTLHCNKMLTQEKTFLVESFVS